MDCSTPRFPVLHHLPEFAQTHVYLSQWCHPAISCPVTPFSSCPQSSPASGSFPVSWFFVSGGQSIEASASASVLPMNIQCWFPLGVTGLISLQSKGLSNSQHCSCLLLPVHISFRRSTANVPSDVVSTNYVLTPHNNHQRWVLLLTWLFWWPSWSSEMLNNLPKGTLPARVIARFQTPDLWALEPLLQSTPYPTSVDPNLFPTDLWFL